MRRTYAKSYNASTTAETGAITPKFYKGSSALSGTYAAMSAGYLYSYHPAIMLLMRIA